MNVMVTGATGFIGEHVAKKLLERGETVHLLHRRPVRFRSRPAVRLFPGDILDAESVERATAGCNCVYHIAAYARNWSRDPAVFTRVNVEGTRTILRAALKAGVRRVVVTSSVMSLGPTDRTPMEEYAARATPILTEYERSKIAAEAEAAEWNRRGLEVVCVNPSRVFGPGLLTEGNSMTKMIQMFMQGTWRLIPGDGNQLGNYAYVEDVALGHIGAMEHGTPGGRYILGGHNMSFNELFDTIGRLSGKRRKLFHLPDALALAFGRVEEGRARILGGYPMITPGWVKTFLGEAAYSSARAERELGYRITPFETALRLTIEWIKHYRSDEVGL